MKSLYQENAPKKSTNLSINSDLLAKSKAMQINLSALLESALRTQLAAAESDRWKKKNKLAIAAYNKHVDEQGCFGDSMRDF